MKHKILSLAIPATLAVASLGSHAVFGQDVVQSTTTTSAGTITDFSPQTIIVRTENAPEPVRYTYTKSTIYVDENGNPVSIETVKSGAPVTVYYTRADDGSLVASKVIVRKTVTEPPAPEVQESKTTTTTTTTK